MSITLHPDQAPRSWPERALSVIGVAMFLVTFISTLAGVFARYFGLHGFEWSFEIATMSFVWVTFIGTVIAELRHENVRFQGFVSLLPVKVQRWLQGLGCVALLVISVWLLVSGSAAIARGWALPTPVLRWPSGLTMLALISASSMLAIIALVRLWFIFQRRETTL
ncbi:MAG TPA: TRAP transporter small permease subunit [Pseudomonas sp.]|jgi:TRAP-type C4-dicarboxylate transport system permease small subunit|uniref:TRAP transporter small permease n=1 Tax=Pseudomonas sp. TaxID=306 RepID=UPI002ED97F46